jgi:cytochrome c peroxidase
MPGGIIGVPGISRYSRAPGTMRDRARFLLPHAGLVALALAGGCGHDGPLTDDEMAQLRVFLLPAAGPPPDWSNTYGDSAAAAALGQMLYFDPRISGQLRLYNATDVNGALGNNGDGQKVSCSSCHDPAVGGADIRSRPNETSLGASYTERNAPTVINAAYSPLWQFWDGHADSLWSQALLPPEGASECNGSRLRVAHVLYDHYRAQYDAIFPRPLPDALAGTDVYPSDGKPGEPGYETMTGDKGTLNAIYANFGKAIAAYERRLVSNNFQKSPFDSFMDGNADAMSPAAVRGARLFIGRAGCAECHRGPTFSDFAFHNVGTPQTGAYVPTTDLGRSAGIDTLGQLTDGMAAGGVADDQVDFTRSSLYSDAQDGAHLAGLTSGAPSAGAPRPTDGQFKTPTLRNVGKTAPYMHDGAYKTLWEVVNHYNFGGATGPYAGKKDPALAPLLLSDAELGDLVEFLRALDDGDPLDPALVTRPPLP